MLLIHGKRKEALEKWKTKAAKGRSEAAQIKNIKLQKFG